MQSVYRSKADRRERGVRAGTFFVINYVPLRTFRVRAICPELSPHPKQCQQWQRGTRRQRGIGWLDLLLDHQGVLGVQALMSAFASPSSKSHGPTSLKVGIHLEGVPQAIIPPFDSSVQPSSDTSPHLLKDGLRSAGEV